MKQELRLKLTNNYHINNSYNHKKLMEKFYQISLMFKKSTVISI